MRILIKFLYCASVWATAGTAYAQSVPCEVLTLTVSKPSLQVGEPFDLKITTGVFVPVVPGGAGKSNKPLDFTISIENEITLHETALVDPFVNWKEFTVRIRGMAISGQKQIVVTMPRALVNDYIVPNCVRSTTATVAKIAINVEAALSSTLSTTGFTGLWWNAKTSGQGIFFSQNAPSNTAFVGWFTYDDAGEPRWYVGDSCAMANNTCSTKLYETNGALFDGANFYNAALKTTPVGQATFNFASNQTATMTYTLKNVNGRIDLARQPY